MEPTRILLAVDGRPATEAAIRWAADRAGLGSTSLRIVSVATDDAELLAIARAAVRAAAETVAARGTDAVVTTEVPAGNVFDTIVRLSSDADLLVVGADRSSPLRSLLHAGLPRRLTGRVGCDLVIVPTSWPDPVAGRVVVGWDDDEQSRVALEAGAAEAVDRGQPLHLVHAWGPVAVAHYDVAVGADTITALEEAERSALERAIRETAQRHPALAVTGELVLGTPAAAIVARSTGASLIVVGTRRRTAVGEILLGAVDDDVIGLLRTTPVMVVRNR